MDLQVMRVRVGMAALGILFTGVAGCSETHEAADLAAGGPSSAATMASRSEAVYAIPEKSAMIGKSPVIAIVEARSAREVTAYAGAVAVPSSDPHYPYAPGFTPTPEPYVSAEMTAVVTSVLKGVSMVGVGDQVAVRFLPIDGRDLTAQIAKGGRYLVYLTPATNSPAGAFDSLVGPYSIMREVPSVSGRGPARFVPIVENEKVPSVTAADAAR